MNKRINELFGQALDAAVPYTWQDLDHVEVEKVMKVFAELIVKECATALDAYLNVCNSNRMIGWRGKNILKHFGVEE